MMLISLSMYIRGICRDRSYYALWRIWHCWRMWQMEELGESFQRPTRFVVQWWWVAHEPIQIATSCPFTDSWVGPSVGERYPPESCHPSLAAVLTCIGFLATGTFQRELADRSGISQPTFSRILPDVLGVIALSHNINFPYTVGDLANTKAQFAAKSDFPNVIGAIDCTHIAIRAEWKWSCLR